MIKRGWRVLRDDGPVKFVSNTVEYLRRVSISRKGIEISYQTGTRVDFEDRWDLLSAEVDLDGGSLLDIGCAEGYFTAGFAEEGLVSIGIERQTHTVATARKTHANQSNLGFLQYEITPETINRIPTVDVVLLLAVYHHWVNEFGWQDAEKMLEILGNHCETLLIEIPGREPEEYRIDADVETLDEYYQRYLESVFNDQVNVTFLQTTDYKGGERDELIYSVEI